MKRSVKTMRFIYWIVMLNMLLICQLKAQQQLGTYIHYQKDPELINPAYIMLSDHAKLYALGRSQWTGISGAPQTLFAGGHFKTKGERSAVGFNMIYDKIGPERYTEVNGSYIHGVQLSENDFISGAVSLGLRFYNTRFNMFEENDVQLKDDIQERVGSIGLSFAYYRPEQLYIGVSMPRIGDENFENVQIFREHFSVIGSYLLTVDEGFHIKLSSWAALLKDRPAIVNLSAMMYLNRKIGLGVNYGTTKDIGLLASFALNNKLRFGYGYQFGSGSTSMNGMRNTTHEISLSYHFTKGGIKIL